MTPPTSNLNLPNALTGARILLVPLVIRLLLEEGYGAALGVFAAAGLTDALDGYVAKRWNRCTRLGELLDPIADKLLVISTVVLLAGQGRLPGWLAAAIVGRDATILGGAAVVRAVVGRLEIAPTRLSKCNTVVQIATLMLVLAEGAGAPVARTLPAAYALTLATTLASGVHYVYVWVQRASHPRREPEA